MVFFSYFKNFNFLGTYGVKGQTTVQNDKNICLLHSISQEPNIIWLSFMVQMCEMIISWSVFFNVKILLFQVVRGAERAKNGPKMTKISVCCTLNFRNHIPYDLHLWCTCMYERIISAGIFSFFSKFWFSGSLGGSVKKGKKWPKMTRNSASLTLYLRTIHDCDFWYTFVKWWYIQQTFSFFKILIFGFFRVVKGQTMT